MKTWLYILGKNNLFEFLVKQKVVKYINFSFFFAIVEQQCIILNIFIIFVLQYNFECIDIHEVLNCVCLRNNIEDPFMINSDYLII